MYTCTYYAHTHSSDTHKKQTHVSIETKKNDGREPMYKQKHQKKQIKYIYKFTYALVKHITNPQTHISHISITEKKNTSIKKKKQTNKTKRS